MLGLSFQFRTKRDAISTCSNTCSSAACVDGVISFLSLVLISSLENSFSASTFDAGKDGTSRVKTVIILKIEKSSFVSLKRPLENSSVVDVFVEGGMSVSG